MYQKRLPAGVIDRIGDYSCNWQLHKSNHLKPLRVQHRGHVIFPENDTKRRNYAEQVEHNMADASDPGRYHHFIQRDDVLHI